MKSKTIILSSNKKFESNSPRAILTLIADSFGTEGKIRLYNLTHLEKGVKLGIYYNNEVLSANLVKDGDAYNFKMANNIDLNSQIYCALVDTLNKNEVLLSGGNDLGFCFSDELVEDEDNVEIEEAIDNNIDKPECDKDCKNCVYKKYFYEHIKDTQNPKQLLELEDNKTVKSNDVKFEKSTTEKEEFKPLFDNECYDYESFEKEKNLKSNKEINQEEILANNIENVKTQTNEKNIQNEQTIETENFINAISEQLDEMFATYPLDDEIMKIIPNSKIVKVTDNLDNSSYVVGIIYEQNKIEYLLYGVPAKYNSPVPSELGENYQWLVLNPDDPMSDGYYLIYQDATTGKLIPINID